METRVLLSRSPVEFSIAVQCCLNSFGGKASDPRNIFIEDVDWRRFVRLVRFHRIEGLVWNSLARDAQVLPDEVNQDLSQAASRIAVRNLQLLAECRSLAESFQCAGIPLLFLKGLPVGSLAYGNASLKSAIDIDLLIDPADLERSVPLLRDRGYRHVIPPETVDDSVLRAWHRRSKESVWLNDTRPRIQIDLHTRCADNARLIPAIDVHSPRMDVDVGGGLRLPTLAPDEQFAYLAVHGASSAWFRLKWISDLAALLPSNDAEELHRLYARSQDLGAGRAAGQALLLADALFGSLANAPDLRCNLIADRAMRKLFRTALALVSGDPVEPTEKLGGTWPMHWTQLLLLPRLSFKLSELRRQVARILADRWA